MTAAKNLSLRPRLVEALLSVSTGVLLVLAFPKFSLSFLAWVALAPLLVAVDGAARSPLSPWRTMRRAAALGWVAGFVFFGGTLYWIRLVMLDYGGMGQAAAAAVYAAFVALLALFFALFAALAWLLLRRLPEPHVLWGVPALWVAVELLRAHIFTGFPWLLLGYAPADHLLVAQMARFGGVYLLSFLAALFGAGVALVARNPSRPRGTALAAGIFALAAGTLGGARLPEAAAPETAYLVQAQAPLDEDWSKASFHKMMTDLETRVMVSYARNESRAGLVLFPEMRAPMYYPDDELLRERLHRLARQTGSPMVVNVVSFADPEHRQVFNSAVLVGAAGDFQGRYDKIHLVPFGEYVPLKKLFFFMEKVTTEVGDFRAGWKAEPLGGGLVGALICYENIFPDLVRRFSARGAAVLVNLSNDGWYGESAARGQLLLMSRLRAVENGRWLLRATNTGITAVIDPWGRVRAFPPGRREVFTAQFGYRTGRTPFVAFGHWFSALAAAAAAALVIWAARAEKAAGKTEGIEP